MFTSPEVQDIVKKDVLPKIPGGSRMENAVSGFLAEPHTLSQGPGTFGSSPGFRLGEFAGNTAQKHRMLGPVGGVLDAGLSHPAAAGLIGAGIGGLGGLGYGAFNRDGSPVMSALIGALGVGGASALLSFLANRQTKQAFYQGDVKDAKEFVELKIARDSAMPFSMKAKLSELINQLSDGQMQQLAKMLKTGLGAGVGALIARFLLKLGVGGTLLGALAGGFVTSRFSSAGPAISRDVFGNARLLQ